MRFLGCAFPKKLLNRSWYDLEGKVSVNAHTHSTLGDLFYFTGCSKTVQGRRRLSELIIKSSPTRTVQLQAKINSRGSVVVSKKVFLPGSDSQKHHMKTIWGRERSIVPTAAALLTHEDVHDGSAEVLACCRQEKLSTTARFELENKGKKTPWDIFSFSVTCSHFFRLTCWCRHINI